MCVCVCVFWLALAYVFVSAAASAYMQCAIYELVNSLARRAHFLAELNPIKLMVSLSRVVHTAASRRASSQLSQGGGDGAPPQEESSMKPARGRASERDRTTAAAEEFEQRTDLRASFGGAFLCSFRFICLCAAPRALAWPCVHNFHRAREPGKEWKNLKIAIYIPE